MGFSFALEVILVYGVVTLFATIETRFRDLFDDFAHLQLLRVIEAPFIKPILVLCPVLHVWKPLELIIDTGYHGEGLVTRKVVEQDLKLGGLILPAVENVCYLLDGQPLLSTGTIELRWKGLRRTFKTRFHVIDGDDLPYQILIGAQAIHREKILRFGGFMGRSVHPKRSKDDKSSDEKRREECRKKAEAHDQRVASNKYSREDKQQHGGQSSLQSSAGSPGKKH